MPDPAPSAAREPSADPVSGPASEGPPVRPATGVGRSAIAGAWASGLAFLLLGAAVWLHFAGERAADRMGDRVIVNGREVESIGEAAKEVVGSLADSIRGAKTTGAGGATTFAWERPTPPEAVWSRRALWAGLALAGVGSLLGWVAWARQRRGVATYVALWPFGVVLVLVMGLGSSCAG
ncbi:MAG: hypothetical protein RIB60_09645 [Phycisphaerales bacterium]